MTMDACDISDACDELGIEAVRTGVLVPAWAGCPAVSGPVITVRLEPGGDAPLADLLEVLAGAADGVVLVDLAGRVDVQCWGTALATAARRFGVRGALVNGAVRDVDGLRELGFPTYTRGVHPARMRGRVGVVGTGVSVDIDGGVVQPGAIVAADRSGAVFFPGEHEPEVVALARELRRREDLQLRAITDGADPRVAFGSTEGADAT